jgi:membrane dipeptidase
MNRRHAISTIIAGLGAIAKSAKVLSGDQNVEQQRRIASPLVVDGLDCSVPSAAYVRSLRKAGVDCMHLSIEDMDARGNVHPFVFIYERLDTLRDELQIARSVAEIERCRQQGRIALVLGWQGADPINVEAGTLRAYYEMGLRIVGIAYNTTNRYGSGCLEPTKGLTDEGRRLVAQLHDLRVVVDVGGHTGEQTSLDAISMSAGRPVICSHTALAALNPNRRNTSNKVCEAIAGTGGVIGVLTVNDFLARNAANAGPGVTPQVPLSVYLDHIDYLKRLVGVDHVGLGPDFVEGQDVNAPGAWPGQRFTPDMISPGDMLCVKGFERIDEIGNVRQGLSVRGWSTTELDKLFGLNWIRVYRAVWGS